MSNREKTKTKTLLKVEIAKLNWNLDAKTSQLIKEKKCLNHKKRNHTMLNCLKNYNFYNYKY